LLQIAVAPTGARKTKSDHPEVPVSPGELAETAKRCLDAGASMIHVHVRDANGGQLLGVDAYKRPWTPYARQLVWISWYKLPAKGRADMRSPVSEKLFVA
jgi:uncharacterized protein (DUF849 family)